MRSLQQRPQRPFTPPRDSNATIGEDGTPAYSHFPVSGRRDPGVLPPISLPPGPDMGG
jgi:hypothetical protein